MNYPRLPKGYRYAGAMDFVRTRKQMYIVSFLSLGLILVMTVSGLLLRPIGPTWAMLRPRWWLWLLWGAMMLIYIPLHELTHGVLMHALSGVRPKYGFRFAYAYAGSTVWFDRGSHILIALAPVVLWGVVFQVLCHTLARPWFWIFWTLQISNVSGSAGDLYCAFYLARMRGDLLIQDTGTRMRIMRRQEGAEH